MVLFEFFWIHYILFFIQTHYNRVVFIHGRNQIKRLFFITRIDKMPWKIPVTAFDFIIRFKLYNLLLFDSLNMIQV